MTLVFDVVMSGDLADQAEQIKTDFEESGISVRLSPTYSMKSGGPVPAVFIVDFTFLLNQIVTHVLDHVEDWIAIGILLAINHIRKRLKTRKVHVLINWIDGEKRVTYWLPGPPDENPALEAIETHFKKSIFPRSMNLRWHQGRWVDERDLLD